MIEFVFRAKSHCTNFSTLSYVPLYFSKWFSKMVQITYGCSCMFTLLENPQLKYIRIISFHEKQRKFT